MLKCEVKIGPSIHNKNAFNISEEILQRDANTPSGTLCPSVNFRTLGNMNCEVCNVYTTKVFARIHCEIPCFYLIPAQ